MKKVLFVLMSFAMLGMMSCSSCSKEKPVFNGYDVDSVMAADQKVMADLCGDSVRFYECQAHYMYNLDSVAGDNQVIWVRNVFQVKDTSYQFFHFADSNEISNLVEYFNTFTTPYVYTIDTNEVDYTISLMVNDYWLEDQNMNLGRVEVSLDSAYAILMAADCIKPHSNFVVMRQPLTAPPFPIHPYYIFGSMIDCMAIDSHTGDFVDNF
jgi:hypothetical protein